jgi:putative acetyltransferase
MVFHVRHYQPGEELRLWSLFFNTVRQVNLRDYTVEQVQVWAPDQPDEALWIARIQQNNSLVCVLGEHIVGFADVQADGYIDQFFIDHQFQGQGAGQRLMTSLEADAMSRKISSLYSNVSITAKPFFERCGFQVVTPQEVRVGETVFINYRMTKNLT